MADITIDAAAVAGTSRGMRAVVFTTDLIGYVFLINADNDLDYYKTADGGQTWTGPTDVFTGTVEAFDVWYDQWTPGDTGRMIHIWYIQGGTGDDLLYTRLNTSGDVQTDITVVSLTSTAAGRPQFFTGTKTRGGNLLCVFNIDAGAEMGCYRSVDNGATWAVMTSPMEANGDQGFLFPANVADPQDAWLLYQDADTNELTLKEFDDSGNSWSESAALTMTEEGTDATGQYGFSGAVRHSDGHLIVAFANAYDSPGAGDLKVYDMNGTGSLTALTDIITDQDDFYYPSVFMDQRHDRIYVAYVGKSDGLEDLTTGVGVYYAVSKDRGLTWTKDVPYSESVTDYRQCWTPLSGPKFFVAWMDISALAIVGNAIRSLDFAFTALNNYMFPRCHSSGMQMTEKIR